MSSNPLTICFFIIYLLPNQNFKKMKNLILISIILIMTVSCKHQTTCTCVKNGSTTTHGKLVYGKKQVEETEENCVNPLGSNGERTPSGCTFTVE